MHSYRLMYIYEYASHFFYVLDIPDLVELQVVEYGQQIAHPHFWASFRPPPCIISTLKVSYKCLVRFNVACWVSTVSDLVESRLSSSGHLISLPRLQTLSRPCTWSFKVQCMSYVYILVFGTASLASDPTDPVQPPAVKQWAVDRPSPLYTLPRSGACGYSTLSASNVYKMTFRIL